MFWQDALLLMIMHIWTSIAGDRNYNLIWLFYGTNLLLVVLLPHLTNARTQLLINHTDTLILYTLAAVSLSKMITGW